MYLAGLSYLVTFGLILYLTFLGPAHLRGFVGTFSGDAMVIQSVEADSEVGRGGLCAGDRVVLIDDRPVRIVRDWTEATGNLQAGRAQRWVVSRGGDRVTLEIVPAGASLQSRLNEGYAQYFSLLLPGYFLGLLIAWKRPADPVARIGAWFTITASMAFGFPVGWAVAWRALPTALQLLLWIPQLSRFVLEAIFLSFFVLFPRRLVARRWGMVRYLATGTRDSPLACQGVLRSDSSGPDRAHSWMDSAGRFRADDALYAYWNCRSCNELSTIPGYE
jgi:hypothetical protein